MFSTYDHFLVIGIFFCIILRQCNCQHSMFSEVVKYHEPYIIILIGQRNAQVLINIQCLNILLVLAYSSMELILSFVSKMSRVYYVWYKISYSILKLKICLWHISIASQCKCLCWITRVWFHCWSVLSTSQQNQQGLVYIKETGYCLILTKDCGVVIDMRSMSTWLCCRLWKTHFYIHFEKRKLVPSIFVSEVLCTM